MNETQGGVNPSGYLGTGYGYSINRLPVSTPQQPIATATDGMIVQAAPVTNTGSAMAWTQVPVGHPHFQGFTPIHIGILGIHFNPITGRFA